MYALAVGSGRHVKEEVKQALSLLLSRGSSPSIYAANQSVFALEEMGLYADYWISLHPENFDEWQKQLTYWPQRVDMTDKRCCFNGLDDHASSGAMCVRKALMDGHTKIIMAGIPMDAHHLHFNDTKLWTTANTVFTSFVMAVNLNPELDRCVRSMSGLTRELLGEPTLEWLTTFN